MTPDIGLANWFRERALAHARAPGPPFRRPRLDLFPDAARNRGLRRPARRNRNFEGRPGRLSRPQPADVPVRHVRLGAARRDLRAAQLPPHRARARLHDRGLRGERPDRRRRPSRGRRAAPSVADLAQGDARRRGRGALDRRDAASDRSRSAHRRTTSRSSCTPRGRPAAPRAPCSPMATSGGTMRAACTRSTCSPTT